MTSGDNNWARALQMAATKLPTILSYFFFFFYTDRLRLAICVSGNIIDWISTEMDLFVKEQDPFC